MTTPGTPLCIFCHDAISARHSPDTCRDLVMAVIGRLVEIQQEGGLHGV